MKKTLLVVLIVITVIGLGLYAYLRSYIPDYDGTLAAPGLSAPVTIERNRFAVPTITAKNMDDLYFAWGYVNAQDRLFQMEFTRRVGQGRICEFAGESALDKDIFLRAVGFYPRARDYAKRMPPDFRRLYQRYVDGVNHYLDTEGPNLYMKLLGMKKEKWEIADSVTVGMMLNWSLAYNMKHEVLYHRIAKKIGRERAAKLLNLVPPKTSTVVDDRVASAASDAALAAVLKDLDWLLGCRSASNNWAVGPARTSHGGAIFCSDMQVHQSKLPNDFYMLHVRAGDFDVAGAQVAGMPFVASGYNRHLAWGLTNQGADMVDLFKENINWKKKTYRFQGKDYPLAAREEVFVIKGKEPLKKTLYYAGRKPVLTEVFKDLGFDVSLDWTGFDGISLDGFLMINKARTYEECMAGAAKIRMTPQNMAYADDRGNIAFRVIGSLPRREKGTGNLISDGEKVKSNWNGNIPEDAYPMVKNPPRGFVATANNKSVKDYPYEMNGTFSPGYRYENIARLLRDKTGIDVEYMKKAQTNTHTVMAKKVQAILKKYVTVKEADELVKKAYDTVLVWDGDSRKDAAAPSIYNTFYVRFAYGTLADELGPELAAEYVAERYISMERFFDMVENGSPFFDDVTTPAKESAADIATRAFTETVSMLKKLHGGDVDSWQWGKTHAIKWDHVLGASALFRPFVNYGPFPFEGDGETNNRARFNEMEPPFIADLASAPRIIVRFDPKPKGYMMLITGDNEYFMSRHNTDMNDAWLDHEYFCMEDEPVAFTTVMEPEKK